MRGRLVAVAVLGLLASACFVPAEGRPAVDRASHGASTRSTQVTVPSDPVAAATQALQTNYPALSSHISGTVVQDGRLIVVLDMYSSTLSAADAYRDLCRVSLGQLRAGTLQGVKEVVYADPAGTGVRHGTAAADDCVLY